MSNWIDYELDVLASNPTEINRIAERLKQPSTELVCWVAQRNYTCGKLSPDYWKLPSADRNRVILQLLEEKAKEFANNPSAQSAHVDIDDLRELVEFKAAQNLGYVHESVNKARRFRNSFKDRCVGIVDSHLFEISDEFPSAIFLLTYFNMMASYSGKRVIRAGEVIREVFDGNQQAQALDWVLLDIFAPFKAEYERREYAAESGGAPVEFGSLWNQWVDDVIAAAQSLKDSSDTNAHCDVASDHPKDAFAVSGTSPTDETEASVPANPTPDTTPPVEQHVLQHPTPPALTNSSTNKSDPTSQSSEVSNG